MDIYETAELWGLDTMSTNNHDVIIGFKNFEQAKYLASKFRLEVHEYRMCDGSNNWKDMGRESEPFDLEHKNWGDNYRVFTDDDLDDFYKNEVLPHLDDFDDTSEAMDFIEKLRNLELSIIKKTDDQFVLAENVDGHYEYDSTLEKKAMSYSFDTMNYVIGVPIPKI